jgi:tripartite-type tricarboxylate transporter receptor subunit TctC
VRKLGKQARRLAAAMIGVLALAGTACAQDWPVRPVTMVVPFAAGGPIDTLGRLLAQHLSGVLGQQVVIENVSGAGGMTGSLRVAQATPDGHQFVLGSVGTHAHNQSLYKKPLYDAKTDFTPVALIAEVPLVLITRNDLPPGDLKSFIAHAKANQAKMHYGSAGPGTSTHIGCVMFNLAIGVDVTHVPYRGGGPAMLDLTAGRIDYICNITSTAVPAIEGKTVKAIALLATTRSPALPHLATADEQGLPGFEAYSWNAVFLPRNTPPAIVAKLNSALVAVMDMPAFRDRLKDIGLIVVAPERRTPDYLQKFVASEIDKWAGPIRASGATAD